GWRSSWRARGEKWSECCASEWPQDLCPPWPGLSRPSTPSFEAEEDLAKTWVPTDHVRGLRAHGTHPATGSMSEWEETGHWRDLQATAAGTVSGGTAVISRKTSSSRPR